MRRKDREAMGRDVLSDAGFIGIAGDNMMIRFPRKKCLSISTTRAIWMRSQGAKRWGVEKILKFAASPRRNYRTPDKKLSTHSARSFARSKNDVLA
jgi:hypothetical protein